MVERMKMVHVVTTVSKKDRMLEGLRSLGILHLKEKKSADRDKTERFSRLSKTAAILKENLPKNTAIEKVSLNEEAFETVFTTVTDILEKKELLLQKLNTDTAEIERIAVWGDFDPKEIRKLKEHGCELHFYRIGDSDFEVAKAEEGLQFIRLADVDKMVAIATIGTLPVGIAGTEFSLPEKGLRELQEEVDACKSQIGECDIGLRENSKYLSSFQEQLLKAQNAAIFSAASASAQEEEDIVWISGYIPANEVDALKEKAAEQHWAYAIEDVEDEDENVPTKMQYNKVTKLIEPLFDILGILPGYREQDVSLWFLLFFTLFVAMIIGDAGYGVLILLGAVGFTIKQKKISTPIFLVYVLSIATIIWGAVTGTWFGLEEAMQVPMLKNLVIPNFANYPEYFGVTASAQQNTIMKFSFSIGAIQMALGSILAIKKKIPKKDLSWVADLGWTIAVIGMYLLSLYLVIGENINLTPVGCAVGIAFLLVVVFGGMSPDKTFGQGLKSGLADAFTVFLNTISCFGNVMSYIRLFAVGMASLAIAQSFNEIAAGFNGPLIVVGIIVVLIGHGLNIIMAFLSVVVHGVRLNVLEFSGQVGLEWTGIPYEPFKVNKKIQN